MTNTLTGTRAIDVIRGLDMDNIKPSRDGIANGFVDNAVFEVMKNLDLPFRSVNDGKRVTTRDIVWANSSGRYVRLANFYGVGEHLQFGNIRGTGNFYVVRTDRATDTAKVLYFGTNGDRAANEFLRRAGA